MRSPPIRTWPRDRFIALVRRLLANDPRRLVVLMGIALSLLALAIFGGLFASGDAVFGTWADVVIPVGQKILPARWYASTRKIRCDALVWTRSI